MSYQFPPDVQAQLQKYVATGQYATEDDVLRDALQSLRERDENVSAVKQAIADMEAGDHGKPFDEFVEQFRAEHKVPRDT